MTKIFPLINNFRSNSYFNAFFLNALVTALIAAIAIELRLQLANKNSNIYDFFNKIIHGDELLEYQSFIIEFFITFIISFLVYLMMYLIFDFGGGMMIYTDKEL
jgi:hypothetical protein